MCACQQRWMMVARVAAKVVMAGAGTAALLGLGGCAGVVDKASQVLSSNADAYGVVDARVLRGKANFVREREGSVQLQSVDGPTLTCFGALHYTATSSGSIDMACSDGRFFPVAFQVTGPLSGVGAGVVGKSRLALAYGVSADQAAGFLAVPADRLAPPKSQEPAAAPRDGG